MNQEYFCMKNDENIIYNFNEPKFSSIHRVIIQKKHFFIIFLLIISITNLIAYSLDISGIINYNRSLLYNLFISIFIIFSISYIKNSFYKYELIITDELIYIFITNDVNRSEIYFEEIKKINIHRTKVYNNEINYFEIRYKEEKKSLYLIVPPNQNIQEMFEFIKTRKDKLIQINEIMKSDNPDKILDYDENRGLVIKDT